jgi:hypothetical protein
MEPTAPSEDPPGIARYVFATVFVAACLYNLELGVRVAGVYMLGLSLYEGILGRVPLVNYAWKVNSYLTGPAAVALSAVMIFFSVFFIIDPGVVIRLVAMAR